MQMFLIGDFMTKIKNIITAFTYNKKQRRATGLLAGNDELQRYRIFNVNTSSVQKLYAALNNN